MLHQGDYVVGMMAIVGSVVIWMVGVWWAGRDDDS